jgi:methyl-accepting chemotaxis protein
MTWSGLSLRVKLTLGFGFAVIILFVIAATALYDTDRLTRLTAARATARQFLWSLEQLVSLTRSAENDARGYMLTGDQRFIAMFEDEVKKVPDLFADLEKGDPAQREALRGLRPIVDSKVATLRSLIDRRRQEGLAPLLRNAASIAGDEHLMALQSESASIGKAERAVLNQRIDEAKAAGTFTRITILAGTIIATMALILVGLITSRSITRRIDELMRGAERIREGDLSFRIEQVTGDEIGRLGESFNQMAASLESQNRAIGESGATIAERVRILTDGSAALLDRSRKQTQLTEDATGATEKLSQGIRIIVTLAEEVSTLTQDCASRTTELRALTRQTHGNAETLFTSVEKSSSSTMQMSAAARQMLAVSQHLSSVGEEVVSFVAEMEATADQVRSAARSTADLSVRVREEAEGGGRMVDATLGGIHSSRDTTERASHDLGQLQSELANVSGIITVIEEITERTNLLALNAAIIAAQAGEHGRGFTVVADEIRELADRTRRSTLDIRKIITSVDEGSRTAVTTMSDGVSHVRHAVEQAGEASTALRGIVDRADESSKHMEHIVRSLEEQTAASRRLRQIASRMSDLIGENTRAVEEQAQNTEVMAREAERVRDIGAQVMKATEEETEAEGGIAEAVETIDTEARRMLDLLAAQRHEVDLIATAASTMREIAHENDTVAQELTVTVGVLASRADEFAREVRKPARAA